MVFCHPYRLARSSRYDASFIMTFCIRNSISKCYNSFICYTVDLVVTLVHVSHLLLDQKSSGAKEANTVGTSIVSETALDSVSGEFLGVSGDHGFVALNSGVDDGADDSLVGSSDDESVLFGVVLVLVVDNKSLASVVVGLSLPSSAKFGLVAL